MHWIDWCMVLIPVAVLLVIGITAQKYINGVADFLAAGRKAGRYLLTVADGTAGMGLISVVATFEMNYKSGYALGFWQNLATLVFLVMTLTGFVTYRYRETRVLTMAQFYEIRYNRSFRVFAGFLAFTSGLLNYALFPAVSARFVMYYCHMPVHCDIFGVNFSTFGLLMALFLAIALFIVLTGGQLTTIITDACQGVFAYFGYAAIAIALMVIFSITDVQEAVLSRPEGMSFFNPFNVDKLTSFNLFYIIIGVFGAIYNRNAWLGSQGYLCSASSPHEQKMAGVLGSWRSGFTYLTLTLLCIGAYTYLNSQHYAARAETVHRDIDGMVAAEFPMTADMSEIEQKEIINTRETIGEQMLVPVALREIIPVGLTGIMLAMMLFLMISTDTTYLHSWGTILVQDVILPVYRRPISQKAQITMLRCAILFVAVFAWFFSFYFSQSDYILQFFALTGTIYLGGAGACMIGGLYWRKGTTAGAFGAMIVGLFFALLGFGLNNKWSTVYAYLNERIPDGLEKFRLALESLGEALPFASWETDVEVFSRKFPITSQEIYFLGMVSALLVYVVLSLLTCRRPFNLEKMLHRGKYNMEHFVAADADKDVLEAAQKKRFNWRAIVGITPEYSKGDRIIAWSVVIWTAYGFLFFLVEAVWNLPPAWRWSERTWVNLWIYYSLPLSILVAAVTTVWFTWGTVRDLFRLFRSLREDARTNANVEEDNGMVVKDDSDDNE